MLLICAIFPFSSRKSRHGVITQGLDCVDLAGQAEDYVTGHTPDQ